MLTSYSRMCSSKGIGTVTALGAIMRSTSLHSACAGPHWKILQKMAANSQKSKRKDVERERY